MYGDLQPTVNHHRLNSFFQDLPSMSFSLKEKSMASKLMIQAESGPGPWLPWLILVIPLPFYLSEKQTFILVLV